MSNRKQVWEDWMLLKEDIQSIAGIVQNDVPLSEDDWLNWLEEIDRFKIKFEFIKRDTMELKK